MKTRLLLYTHRVAFAELLEEALKTASGVAEVQRAADGQEVAAAVRSGKTDLVLLDPGHPGEDVFEIARQLRKSRPKLAVIFMADSVPSGWICRALAVEASGFLGTCSTFQDYLRAIRAARMGHRFFSPCAATVVSHLATSNGVIPSLTQRELDVLRLICQGCSTKEIARTLQLQPKTVDSIRARLMEKTRTRRATDLVRFACDERFVDPRPQADRHLRGEDAKH